MCVIEERIIKTLKAYILKWFFVLFSFCLTLMRVNLKNKIEERNDLDSLT